MSEARPLVPDSPVYQTFDPPPNARRSSFWQRPFVQNVLPLLTSVSFHAAVLALGLLTYQSVRVLVQRRPSAPGNASTSLVAGNPLGLGEPLFRGMAHDSNGP